MRQKRKKVLVKLFQKLARSSRVGLAPVATGESRLTAFSFANFSFVISASARPVDDEAEVEIGKNKEYRKRATRTRPRRLCF